MCSDYTEMTCHASCKTSKISRTLVGNKIIDNSDVVGLQEDTRNIWGLGIGATHTRDFTVICINDPALTGLITCSQILVTVFIVSSQTTKSRVIDYITAQNHCLLDQPAIVWKAVAPRHVYDSTLRNVEQALMMICFRNWTSV